MLSENDGMLNSKLSQIYSTVTHHLLLSKESKIAHMLVPKWTDLALTKTRTRDLIVVRSCFQSDQTVLIIWFQNDRRLLLKLTGICIYTIDCKTDCAFKINQRCPRVGPKKNGSWIIMLVHFGLGVVLKMIQTVAESGSNVIELCSYMLIPGICLPKSANKMSVYPGMESSIRISRSADQNSAAQPITRHQALADRPINLSVVRLLG